MPSFTKYPLTILAWDAAPKNVVIPDELPRSITSWRVLRNVFLIDGPAGAGSGTFPAEGDVDMTAPSYGPTGSEYQGTLEQPAEADVKDGVFYGADGTEFEGTYVGTGGGGYSRGRVVNG